MFSFDKPKNVELFRSQLFTGFKSCWTGVTFWFPIASRRRQQLCQANKMWSYSGRFYTRNRPKTSSLLTIMSQKMAPMHVARQQPFPSWSRGSCCCLFSRPERRDNVASSTIFSQACHARQALQKIPRWHATHRGEPSSVIEAAKPFLMLNCRNVHSTD